MLTSPAASSDFFGRKEELSLFLRLLGEAGKGRLHGLFLSGPPGIGKTRLTEEMARAAEAAGAVTLRGTWREGTVLPEYWVWRQVLRDLVNSRRGGRWSPDMKAPLSEVSTLLPEIRDVVPGLLPPMTDDDSESRSRLFDAVYRLLRAACGSHPLLIVLDNLHLAARASLEMCAGLFAEISDCPVLLVCAYRDLPIYRREPFLSFLADALQSSKVHECRLDSLSLAETAGVLAAIIGHPPAREIVEEIHRRTRGLPLFVRETARLCRGRVDGRPEEARDLLESELPSAIGAVMGRRMGQLTAADQDVLRRAAVIGEIFSLEEISLLVDTSDPGAIERSLESGVSHGFLRERDSGFEFSHAVVHEAVRAQLPRVQRRALCRRLAEAAERTRGLPDHSSPAEDHGAVFALRAAGWWALAGGEHARERQRKWIRQAAESALAVRAWEQAAELFARLVPPADRPVRDEAGAEALFGLGRALFMSGDRHGAVGWLGRAFSWHREHGNLDRMIAIATVPGYPNAGEAPFFNFFEQVLDALPPESPSRGMVCLFWATAQWNNLGDIEGCNRSLRLAWEAGLAAGDEVLLARCLPLMAFFDKVNLRPEDALEKLRRAQAFFPKVTDAFSSVHAEGLAAHMLIVLGRRAEALPHSLRAIATGERSRDAFLLAAPCYDVAKLFAEEGRWQEAREIIDKGLAALPCFPQLLTLRPSMEYATGNIETGDAYRMKLLAVARRVEPGPWVIHVAAASVTVLRAWHTEDTQGLRALVSSLQSAADHPEAHPCVRLRARLLLCAVAALTGDDALARRSYRSVLDLPRLYLIRPHYRERILGVAAHAFGDHQAAVVHLEEALRGSRHFGDQATEAMILADLGYVHLPPDPLDCASGDARRCLAAARDRACALGMPPLQKRVERLMGRLRGPDGEAFPVHVHLSGREKEVLALLARGSANKEIAAALGISVHTAAHHVQSILSKTNAANRTEAVAIIRAQGAAG